MTQNVCINATKPSCSIKKYGAYDFESSEHIRDLKSEQWWFTCSDELMDRDCDKNDSKELTAEEHDKLWFGSHIPDYINTQAKMDVWAECLDIANLMLCYFEDDKKFIKKNWNDDFSSWYNLRLIAEKLYKSKGL